MFKIVEVGKIKNENGKRIKSFVLSILSEFGFPLSPKFDYDLDDFKSFYQKPDNNFWVLIKNQEILGTIGIVKKNKKTAQLKRFYLRKGWRGKGWGRKLFGKAIRFCKRRGYQVLFANTTQRNKEAIRFFKKAGFKLKKQKGLSLYFSKELTA